MAKLPTYERQVAPGPAPTLDSSTGGVERYATQKGIFARLGAKISAWTDRVVVNESERQGMMAGLDPEFRPTHGNSLAAMAFDRAGTRAFLDMEQNRLAAQIDQLAIAHEADPAALAQAIMGLEQATVDALKERNFPEAQVAFAGFFARARTSYVREAIRAKNERDRQFMLAAANEAFQRRSNEADRLARSAGLDPEADAALAGTIEEQKRDTDAMVDAGVITPEEGRRRNEELDIRARKGRVLAAFERLGTIEEKQKFLTEAQTDYAANKDGIADILSGDDFEDLERQMQTAINNAIADRRAALTDIDRAANSVEDRNSEGFSVPAPEIAALEAAAAASGDPVAIDRVEQTKRFQALTEQLTKMTPLEVETVRRQTVLEMEKNGATPRGMEVLKAIDSVSKKRADALSSDPYAWGARVGKIKQVPALTFDGGPAQAATLTARLRARDQLRQHYGNSVPFFTKAERELISDLARNGGPQALGVAQSLVGTLGAEAPDVLAEISEDAPVLANAAGLMANGGSAAIAADAMDALAARKLPDYKPVSVTDAAEQLTARGVLGEAYIASARTESAVRNTAKLAFEKRVRDMGLTGDLSADGDALELYERTLDEAAGATWRNGIKYGGVDEVNGAKTIVPPDVPEGEVERLLGNIDSAGLPPIAAVNGVPIASRQLQGAKLVSVGNGRWRVALGDPRSADPQYVMKPDGSFYTLTVDDLRRAQHSYEEQPGDSLNFVVP